MAKTHSRTGYARFRLKVMLTVLAVVLATLMFQNTLLLYPPFALLGLPGFLPLFGQILLIMLPVALPIFALLAIVIARTLNPLHTAVQAIAADRELDDNTYFRARRSIALLWKNILITNLAAYLVAWLIGAVMNIEMLLSLQGALQLLFSISIAALAALVQYSVITLLIARPRAMLKIYAIDHERDVRGQNITTRTVHQSQIIALFLLATMSFGYASLYTIEQSFRTSMTEIALGQTSLQEAEDAYHELLSPIPGFDVPRAEFDMFDYQPQAVVFARLLVMYIILLALIAGSIQFLASRAMLSQIKLIRVKLQQLVAGGADLTG